MAGYEASRAETIAAAGLMDMGCFCTDVLGLLVEGFQEEMIGHQLREQYSLVLLPRGYGKTTVGTVGRSNWEGVRDSDIRVLVASHSAKYSYDISSETRHNFGLEALRGYYGEQMGRPWTSEKFNLSGRRIGKKESNFTYIGVGQATIGWHGELILVDDVVTEDCAQSERQREILGGWWRKSLWPCRLPETRFSVVGTRYHPLDLYEHFIESGLWGVLIKGALLLDGKRLSGDYSPVDLRELNEAGRLRSLWPPRRYRGERFGYSVEELIAERKELGPIPFALSRLNDVELARGQIFKGSWFRWYDGYGEMTAPVVAVCSGVDPAVGEREQNDFFANYGVALTADNKYYLLPNMSLGRPNWSEKIRLCMELHEQRRAAFPGAEMITVIENNQAQKYLAEAIRLEYGKDTCRYPDHSREIRDERTDKDKVARAWRVSGYFERGEVYFPLGNYHAEQLAAKLPLFPAVTHDDDFDALEIAIQTLRPFRGRNVPHPLPGQRAGGVTGDDFQEMMEKEGFWVEHAS